MSRQASQRSEIRSWEDKAVPETGITCNECGIGEVEALTEDGARRCSHCGVEWRACTSDWGFYRFSEPVDEGSAENEVRQLAKLLASADDAETATAEEIADKIGVDPEAVEELLAEREEAIAERKRELKNELEQTQFGINRLEARKSAIETLLTELQE